MSEEQKLTRTFVKLFVNKATSDFFIKQLQISKSLLKKYKFDDLMCLLEYLHDFPLKEGVRSLAYIQYIYDKYIEKAKRYKMSKNMPEINLDREESIKQNIVKSSKSLFKNKKIF